MNVSNNETITVRKNNVVYCVYTKETFDKEDIDSLYSAGYAVYLGKKKLTIRQAKTQL